MTATITVGPKPVVHSLWKPMYLFL
uniref:Uncharacterized protein n=1 Tax=Anguilla anguilla TaxID=7936 RepID=A0A0E9RLB0_ANGAN